MHFTNTREISCFGLRRSGNHAILNWIIKQNNGSFVHLNNVKLYTSKDPYESFTEATIGGISPLIYHRGNLKFRRFIKYLINSNFEYIYGGNRQELDRVNLRNYRLKSLLIHNYEHYTLSNVLGDWFDETREDFLGKSQYKFNVLILRDPYNTFASLIKKKEKLDDLAPIVQKWVEHAKEYLGVSNYLPNRVSINYNEWFQSKDYRQTLTEALGLPFTDAGVDLVPSAGQGSSFDKVGYDGKASQMGVLSRYKDFLDHPVMTQVIANPEIKDLSQEIFGYCL